MKAPRYICAFYRPGLEYGARLASLRARNPEARICAMVPSNFELLPEHRKQVDEVIETKKASYSLLDVGACLTLVRMIRKAKFDYFVFMFDTAQLNMLAALSGARRKECWDDEGRILRLPVFMAGVVARLLFRPLFGWVQYHYLRFFILLTPLGGDDYREGGGSPQDAVRDLGRDLRRRRVWP